MELNNLTINFLGDSITEGCCVENPDDFFVNRIAAITGGECRNYGIGGTRIARQSRNTRADHPTRYSLDFNARLVCMDHNADLVIVFGGTNDYGHGTAPLGSNNDRTEYTFYGAMHCLCQGLLRHYPSNRIVFLTPLYRFPPAPTNLLPPLEDYINIIREVTAQYGLPLLDLYADSAIHPRNPGSNERYTADGLHPNAEGHGILAQEILEFLKTLP